MAHFSPFKRQMRSPADSQEVTAGALRATLAQLGDFTDADFREFQWGLVSRYRVTPEDQELIAVELSRPSGTSLSAKSLGRIEEILAMLDHVHDPLISGSSLRDLRPGSQALRDESRR